MALRHWIGRSLDGSRTHCIDHGGRHAPHTVTAKGVFDSRSIAAGKSWKYVARTLGEYPYLCTFHPNMKGTLRVLPVE